VVLTAIEVVAVVVACAWALLLIGWFLWTVWKGVISLIREWPQEDTVLPVPRDDPESEKDWGY
jgi:hypothetical protein